MHQMLDESFDQFGRYAYLWELRQQCLSGRSNRILDVGDPFGTIARLFPDDDTVSLDLFADSPARGRHQHVVGSGFDLPFPDGAFDLVASHDAFEHLPADRRLRFVDELLRVAAGPVVLVAPFDDQRTTVCERLVNDFFKRRVGRSIEPLEEHRELGLPDLRELVDHLTATGVEHETLGDGSLDHWLAFYLLKGHLFGQGRNDDVRAIDRACNELLRTRDRRPPHYRRIVVLRPPADRPERQPATGAADGDDVAELEALAGELRRVLPRGVDVLRATSPLTAWVATHRQTGSEYAEIAESLGLVLDHVTEAPDTHASDDGARAARAATLPVSVVIPNFNGEEFLAPCLDSLAAQDYPRELTEVLVVDNASADRSLDLLAEQYPWVRVVALDRNTGFAPAVNAGVRVATGHAVALINNDMRADPSWLSSLVARFDPEEDVVCVGGAILSWDGETIDFAGGAINFHGMGGQHGFGRRTDTIDLVDGSELPFACGGSMLVDRQVYLDTGGFDDAFFAYFEDVDFGWRLWLLGYRVVLAADARTWHVHNGTSRRFPDHERLVLYERNAIRTILKNYDGETLDAALGPALLLLLKRAGLRGSASLDRAGYDVGADRPPNVEVERNVLAHLHAVLDLVDDLDQVLVQREQIQRNRRRSDRDLLERFGRPMLPVMADPAYLEAQHKVTTFFDLERLFGKQQAVRVLVVSEGEVGEKMRGPAIRAWELARGIARTSEVMLAVPAPTDRSADGVTISVYEDEQSLVRLAERADVVVIQGYALHRAPSLADLQSVMVVDLYDPWLFENLEVHRDDPLADRYLRLAVSVQNALLDRGDFFICASERQRDYWLGMLSARGRLDPGTYGQDHSLRSLIDVVPFGLEDRPPVHAGPVMKGVHPAISPSDRVVLWGGGTWDWFDPLVVVDAFPAVLSRVPDAKLVFLGLQLSGSDVVEMPMADAVMRRAEALGLAGTHVIFSDWVPYDLRESYLLEADVAVSAARDVAETRLAFRSRLLDYFWAGLPVVCTAGDTLADVVERERLGIVVPPADPVAMADALVALLTDSGRRRSCARRATDVAASFRWGRVVTPLRPLLREPWRWRQVRRLRGRLWPPTETAQVLIEVRDQQVAALQAEVARLELERAAVAASLAHAESRLALLRRTPAYPVFRAINKVRRRVTARPEA